MNLQAIAASSNGAQANLDSRSVSRWAKYLMLLIELTLILGVVSVFDVEGRRQFLPILGLICVGAAIHACLPMALRLPFFAVLSLGTVLFVLGMNSGACVLGIGSVLIGIAYLPLRLRWKVLLMMTVGSGLILWRYDSASSVWVVVGSMFMFRMAIYLFDNRRARDPPPLSATVAYFFMLPNVCFPFFPVVDYRRFRETHYDDEEWTIYQRGVGWIFRGIVHLLLFRFIKNSLAPEPYEIQDVLSLSIYLATNYALYLEVSGQFHLITGMLHLFGFNLPRTHDHYFLASSPSDIWRRINIYWKDFLQRLVFFPSLYALRRWGIGTQAAMVAGVFAAFVSTWLLHSWQAYWLLGRFPVNASDAVLWLGVGAVVAVNLLMRYRRSNNPAASRERPQWLDDLSLSLRIVGMFAAVSLFWACWTNPHFLQMTGNLLLSTPGAGDGLLTVLLSLLGLVLGGMACLSLRRFVSSRVHAAAPLTYRDTFALQSIGLVALIVVGLPGFGRMLGERGSLALEELRSDMYVQVDPFTQYQSYYQDLNTVCVQGGPLLTSLSPHDVGQRNVGNDFIAIIRRSEPLLELELISGWTGILDNELLTINQFGMRDRKTLTLSKPPHTLRIAFVGSSVVMGYGIADDEVFSRLFEDDLNAAGSTPSMRFDVLNFATGRHWALHRRVLIDRKVLAFDPDVLYYFAHQDELQGPIVHLTDLISRRYPLPDDSLDEIIHSAGITPDMVEGVIKMRVREQMNPILEAIYRSIVEQCRSRGIVPVYVYLPVPGVPGAPDLSGDLIPMATRAGFVVLNLNDWHHGYAPEDVKAYREDQHLDDRGHRVVAEKLFDAVREHPEALPLAGRKIDPAER